MTDYQDQGDKHVILLALGTPSEALLFEQSLNSRFPHQLEIYRAPSGFDAMSLAMNKPRIVLLDQRLPDVMGMDLIESIREQIGKENYLIFIGGSGKGGMRPGMRDESLKRGATAIADRPIDMEVLIEMIHALLCPTIPQHPHLHGLELMDLIQAYHVKRVHRTLRIFAKDGRVASIYMMDGEISHIEAGAMQGFPAILDLMNWSEGRIEVYDALLSREVTNNMPTQHMLLEAARHMDEATQPPSAEAIAGALSFLEEGESAPPTSNAIHDREPGRHTPPPIPPPSTPSGRSSSDDTLRFSPIELGTDMNKQRHAH